MTLCVSLDRTSDVVEELVALNAVAEPRMGRRDHVAWVMNVLAHVLGPRLVAADDDGRFLPALHAAQVELSAEMIPSGRLGIEVTLPDLPAGHASPPAAAIALSRLFAPAVYALAYAGPLAPRALWRIAGDGLAWGWAIQGGTERGGPILSAYGAPFANRQLSFRRGTVERRGGCCRYLAVKGNACGNCPLRK